MAKNKITIDIEVNGKMQKATVSAKKLRKALDTVDEAQQKVGKSARTADRNLKGAAQASSNSTKNFSKMAQGITSGLVPAYATLAANLFAVSAAFQFLKNASQVARLKEAQLDFTSSTGNALSYLTDRLQKASNGMLSFKEAAAATAIGTAKGFSPKQMEDLAQGAQKVSAALGRDFTDAFDRLIRGTSKAEPELLDELGITLRLEEATKRYGDAIGKNAKDLTTYERSQAVLKETMRQLNEQFGKNEATADPFIRLAKTFDQIINQISQFFLPAFTVLADVLDQNATLAIAAFGAFSYSIIQSIFPISSLSDKVTEWKNNTTSASEAAQKSLKKYQKQLISARKTQKDFTEEGSGLLMFGAGEAKKQGAQAAYLNKLQSGGFESLGKLDQINLRKSLTSAELQIKKTGEVTKGVFKGVSATIVQEMSKGLASIDAGLQATQVKSKSVWAKMTLHVQVWAAKSKSIIASVTDKVAGLAVGAVTKLGRIITRGIFIGFFIEIIYSLREQIIGALDAIFEAAAKGFDSIFGTNLAVSYKEGFGNTLKTYLKDIKEAKKAKEYIESLDESIEALQTTLKGLSRGPMTSEKWLNSLSGVGTSFGDMYEKMADNLDTSSDAFLQKESELISLAQKFFPKKVFSDAIAEANKAGGSVEVLFTSLGRFASQAASAKAEQTALNETLKNFTTNTLKTGNLANIGDELQKVYEKAAEADKQSIDLQASSGGAIDFSDSLSQAQESYKWLDKILVTYKEIRNTQAELQRDEGDLYDERVKLALLSPKQKKFAEIDLDIREKTLAVSKAVAERRLAALKMEQLDTAMKEAGVKVDEATLQAARDEVRAKDLILSKTRSDLDVSVALKNKKEEIATLENKIYDANNKQSVLDLEKQITDEYSKRVTLLNTQASIEQSRLQRQSEQDIRSLRGDFGVLPEAVEATARLDLEQKLSDIKKAAAQREYDLKLKQFDLEQKTAAMRLNIAEMEMRKEYAESKMTFDQGDTFASIRAEMKETQALAKETAAMQLQESIDAADYAVLKAEQAVLDSSNIQKYREAFANSFRQGLSDALDKVQDGDFKDAARQFALTFVEGLKAKIDELFIDSIMFSIFGDQEAIRMQAAHATGGATAATEIMAAFTSGAAAVSQAIQYGFGSASATAAIGEMLTPTEAEEQKLSRELATGADKAAGEPSLWEKVKSGVSSIFKIGEKSEKTTESLGGMKSVAENTTESLEGVNSGANPLAGIFDLLASGGEFIINIFKGLLAGIYRVIASLFTFDASLKTSSASAAGAQNSGSGGGFFSNIASFFGGGGPSPGDGAISNPYMTTGFATGGIASGSTEGYFAKLHGTEAVVPLDSGRSIPVELQGSGNASTNNVAVNINMNGNNTEKGQSSGDAAQAQQLGAAITAAVQKELAVQSRPGGLLSR